jgi:hypothetical protein
VQGHVLAAPHPHAELQALEAIEPAHPLPIDEPAFAPQQHPNALIPKPGSGVRQIANADPQGRLIFRTAASSPRGPAELGQATGPRTTHREGPVKPLGELPAAGGP